MGIQFDVVHYSFPDILTELRDMEKKVEFNLLLSELKKIKKRCWFP